MMWIGVGEARSMASSGALVLDIRKPYELEILRLGSEYAVVNAPLYEDLRWEWEPPHASPSCVIACRTSRRSRILEKLLGPRGRRYYALEGGLKGWYSEHPEDFVVGDPDLLQVYLDASSIQEQYEGPA